MGSGVSPPRLRALGKDAFIALPRPGTRKFFRAEERGAGGSSTGVKFVPVV